ncbi:tRNA uridine-5-carboxymethylaminomethyl(34) synthesis GTPase MnmE [Ferrigenium sp. UT5]|uniref:tRNA uridine-5-carboxymethylaminomethyl(34) synthesis GTPase MnmE n=1 Tax=Ferrigenium sp. UT5 TaxID=3242105 RepID=UPI003552A91A
MGLKWHKRVLQNPETIAAIATAPGQGGIGVVRLSGRDLAKFGQALLGFMPPARYARYTPFLDSKGAIIDHGIALYFPAPNSYTGEDVLELQGHGGIAVTRILLNRCIELGARLAQPGEFTQRAFLNGKLDLAQAESVADLIAATTEQAARSAVRSLEGDFSAAIHAVVSMLIELRAYIEAMIDFPEEGDVPLSGQHFIREKLEAVQSQLTHIQTLARQGSILREGAHIVLVGPPNAGKSSLLNCLAGEEVALVSDIPGTTRDAIREVLQINGVPLHVIDTAGIRQTDDSIELMGITRTRQNMAKADLVLVLIDESNPVHLEASFIAENLMMGRPVIFVHNKIDLTGEKCWVEEREAGVHIYLSAKTGQGVDELKEIMLSHVGWHQEDGVFMARARHLKAIGEALENVREAMHSKLLELQAESLRQAQRALNQITGEFVADDLLGEIFGKFCIGK